MYSRLLIQQSMRSSEEKERGDEEEREEKGIFAVRGISSTSRCNRQGTADIVAGGDIDSDVASLFHLLILSSLSLFLLAAAVVV